MILEATPESVQQAKALLGIPEDARIGFRRNQAGDLEPMLQAEGRFWYVGDEIQPA